MFCSGTGVCLTWVDNNQNTAALQIGKFKYAILCKVTSRLLRQRNPSLERTGKQPLLYEYVYVCIYETNSIYIYIIYIYWCDPVQPTRNGPTNAHARGRVGR